MNHQFKKYFILACLLILPTALPLIVYAQSASAASTVINARILPTVWYSSLSVGDGDSIYIYAGIQNNSGVDFSGVATFQVDDAVIGRSTFISKSGGLIDVSTNWVANPGDHNVQVTVTAVLSTNQTLYSYSSDKASINITRKITPAIIQAAALNTANSVISGIDTATNAWANDIEALKKPTKVASVTDSSGSKDAVGAASVANSVNGAANSINNKTSVAANNSKSDGSILSANIIDSPYAAAVWNFFVDAGAYLVRNWKWTLAGIIILFLGFKAKRFFF